jgi:tRNA threonylcarbamoyladenosine biosynthesis protein TsaE
MLVKKIVTSELEMAAFAQRFAQVIEKGMTIYLSGSLGAGKTTLTRGLLRGLGYTDKVKSPSYTLVEPYEIEGLTIFHFDFYRLNQPDELKHRGILDYFTSETTCLIEWPEKGEGWIPKPDIIFNLAIPASSYTDIISTVREIEVTATTGKGEKILQKTTRSLSLC